MNSKAIYEDLLKQYEQLTLDEKTAILVYKSQLYNILNAMSSIPNFLDIDESILLDMLDKDHLISIFENYKRTVFLNKNITTRYTIFFDIDFTNILTCMKSLKKVYQTILNAKGKIKLKENLIVYRGISLDTKAPPTSLSRGEIISTGLKLDDAFTFLLHKQYNHLYVIEIEAGTNVLVTPYALVATYPANESHILNRINNIEPDVLKIMKLGDKVQEEIILFQSDLTVVESLSAIKHLEDDERPIHVHQVKAYNEKVKKGVTK